MNFKYFAQLFEKLADVYPKKARKLLRLYTEMTSYEDVQAIENAGRKLERESFKMFYSLLSKDSRDRLISDNCVINEEAYLIERKENDGWQIGSRGISRYVLEDNQYVKKSFIPRDYFIGFHLTEETMKDLPEEEKIKVSNFYMNNLNKLTEIGLAMDDKQELITYGYEIGDPNADTELVEMFINFLGYQRLTEEDINRKAMFTKMAK